MTPEHITALRTASNPDEALRRVNRGLRMTSECNQAVVAAVEESALARNICRIIAEVGGHPLVWVGLAATDEPKTLRLLAHAGSRNACLPPDAVAWAEAASDRTPAGIALQTKKPCLENDLRALPGAHPWRSAAAAQHYAAWFALPLLQGRTILGVMCVYSKDRDAFDAEEVRLLAEMAGDLAYGIQAIRTRAERARAEESLRESIELYRTLVENIQLGVSLINARYEIVMINAAQARFFDKPASDFVGKLCYGEFEGRDAVCPYCPGSVAMETRGRAEAEFTGSRSRRAVRVQAFPIMGADGAPTGFIELVEDVTDRKCTQAQLKDSAEKLQKMMDGTIKAMSSALEMRDPYTAGHERRVAQLACAIAVVLGYSEPQIEGIRIAGFFHDIGKIAVPTEILTKPGRINEYEQGMIRSHPQIGFAILNEIEFLWPVALAALQHHERLDGSGYPQGLAGDQIVREARIIAVADVVEAMSSHRPYRPALGTEAAMAEIARNKGVLYDPEVVDACERLFAGRKFQFA